MFEFFFFFSSRRRHTRCGRDWSSDVCSSDLVRLNASPACQLSRVGSRQAGEALSRTACTFTPRLRLSPPPGTKVRSEERRVGKEWRSERAPEDEKKKGV